MNDNILIRCQKVRIYPTNEQKELFEKSFGVARYAWNIALQESLGANECNGITLRNKFTKLVKPNRPWIKEVSKETYANSILDLGKAWKRYFDSWKKTRKGGKSKVGRPKFKSKHNSKQSFTMVEINLDPRKKKPSLQWISHELKIPKCTGRGKALPKIRTAENPRWKQAKIKQVTISRNGDKYYASVRFEVKPYREKVTRQRSSNAKDLVGIDWGVKTLLTLSDGEIFPRQDFTKIDKIIKRRQKQLSRKHKGSSNYEKAKIKLNHATQRKLNMRDDYLHKITSYLVTHYDIIKIEDLRPSNMMKNHSLARRIADNSFYKFKTMLIYKAEQANTFRNGGNSVIVELVDPRNTTQVCSNCGTKYSIKVELKDRVFQCNSCGYTIDRDLNAAINIANK